jgi:hypothetical protein
MRLKITAMLCLLMTMITVTVTKTTVQIKSKHNDGVNGGMNDVDILVSVHHDGTGHEVYKTAKKNIHVWKHADKRAFRKYVNKYTFWKHVNKYAIRKYTNKYIFWK